MLFFKIFFFTQSFFSVFLSSTQYINKERNHVVIDGYINPSLAREDSNYSWIYNEGIPYEPSEEAVRILGNTSDLAFVLFGGSWCEDTRYLVPKYFKLFSYAELSMNKLMFIGVDTNYSTHTKINNYFKISRVPTLIIYRNCKEIGRIVEYGTHQEDFDKNIIDVLSKASKKE